MSCPQVESLALKSAADTRVCLTFAGECATPEAVWGPSSVVQVGGGGGVRPAT